MKIFIWLLPEVFFSYLNIYVYCKVNGGREGRPIGAYELAKAVEELGAGELLLNCINCDGQSNSLTLTIFHCILSSLRAVFFKLF